MKRFLRDGLLAACLAVMLSAFGTCGAAGTKLPVLMYHDLTTDPSKTNSMTVTDERFRLDMEFLQQFGYTPLLPADLINIWEGKMQLPDKAVMVTFDDGYRSNYDYAYPVLQNTGMKAAIAVVAHNIRQEGDADSARHNMTWDELREMVDSGAVEVGSHTYNLHNPQYGGNNAPDGINGVMRLKGESRSAYNARVGGDLSSSVQLILTHTGQEKVNYFSYPFGAYDSWMPDLLAQAGIQVSALTNPGLSEISVTLQGLSRYGITMDRPVSALLRQTDQAVPALAAVSVNGELAKLPAYYINGNNYVRVRDVAVLLGGTGSAFNVEWNSGKNRVELQSFTPYTPLGTENAPLSGETRTVQSITEPTVADSIPSMVAAYNVDGYTYYKLRSLGDLCGFAVDWDEESQTVIVTA